MIREFTSAMFRIINRLARAGSLRAMVTYMKAYLKLARYTVELANRRKAGTCGSRESFRMVNSLKVSNELRAMANGHSVVLKILNLLKGSLIGTRAPFDMEALSKAKEIVFTRIAIAMKDTSKTN